MLRYFKEACDNEKAKTKASTLLSSLTFLHFIIAWRDPDCVITAPTLVGFATEKLSLMGVRRQALIATVHVVMRFEQLLQSETLSTVLQLLGFNIMLQLALRLRFSDTATL